MKEYETTLEEILKLITDRFGEKSSVKNVFSKLLPEVVPKEAKDRGSVMNLPHIPAKYKLLILTGSAFALNSESCTRRFIEIAMHSGITEQEIAETIVLAKIAISSATFESAIDGLGELFTDD